MNLYHGSPFQFEKFDYAKIGENGTSEGFGFYFTDKKQIAENYSQNGYIYTTNLKGDELSGNKLTLTEKEYVKLVKHLDSENGYLDNFGDKDYEGFNKVLSYAIELDYENAESDSDLLGGIINAYGSVESVCKAVYILLGYGYIKDSDCTWGNGQTVYVALVNDVIEITNVETKGGN